MHWADAWLKEAMSNAVQRNANSMTLATVGSDLQPSARIVLCKQFVPDPGYLVFYTNYHSRKSVELTENARVAVVFHWDSLGRQIRLEGVAVRSPESESDAYFATREWGSQLGAWGSDQSEPIASRELLIAQVRRRAAGLGLELDGDTETLAADPPGIPRPPHWGGVRIWASAIELWAEGAARIHDRALWQRKLVRTGAHDFSVTPWIGTRLQP
jgi:pyridoxamine 5'-phosphate oxidase